MYNFLSTNRSGQTMIKMNKCCFYFYSRRRQSYYKDVFIVDDRKVDEYLSALNISKEKVVYNSIYEGQHRDVLNVLNLTSFGKDLLFFLNLFYIQV